MKNIIIQLAYLLFISNIYSQSINTGVVAWYKLDGNGNDASGNGLNGTNNGAVATPDRFGNANSAMYFNNTWIGVANNAKLNFTTSFSMSFWMRKDGLYTGPSFVISKGQDTWNCYNFTGNTTGDAFSINNNGSFDGISMNSLNASGWHHVVCVYDKAALRIKLYVNNTLVQDKATIVNLNVTNSDPFVLGRHFIGSGNSFQYWYKGWLDDVRLYDRALTATDVLELNSLVAPEMLAVPGGTFIMGCTPEQEPDCNPGERPAHEVTVSDFMIGKYEVTQGQWQALFGSNPSNFTSCGANCPVERVSWYDALVFCNRLSEQSGFEPRYYSTATFATNSVYGKSGTTWSLPNSGTIYEKPTANGYRLPTEAEWEYTARGGISLSSQTKYAGSSIIDSVAWYSGNSGSITHPVGQKKQNALGVYDMPGNVWEWCFDWYSNGYTTATACTPRGVITGANRVLRGSSCFYVAVNCRVAHRSNHPPNGRDPYIGFRLARTPNSNPLLPIPPPMVTVPGGTINVGSNNPPTSPVAISTFEIGKYEVTQQEWSSLMGSNPSSVSSCGNDCPVETVSWFDAVVYCNRLSVSQGLTSCYYSDAAYTQVYGLNGTSWSLPNTGTVYLKPNTKGYRLPTEAEWEYAARGATNMPNYEYAGSNTIDNVAWWSSNSGSSTHTKGTKTSNGLAIFDMSGNVWEWCYDWYGSSFPSSPTNPIGPATGADRVFRGGSWFNDAVNSRVALRNYATPSLRNYVVGFRLARTP
jgi:formylglycine-generating enzyme required for sulfatase activity